MKQQSLLSLSLLLLFVHCTKTLSQSPAAAPAQAPAAPSPPAPPTAPVAQPPASASPAKTPAPPAPTNVTKILEKDGHFTIFIRLLKATEEDNHLLTVLNNSNNGLTILAPSDGAFSGLKSGTLNTLSNEQKLELVKFHVLPTFLTTTQFQTVTNPVGTEAGTGGRVALNVTTYSNSVNISTGLTNTSISGTMYSDNQLAIYRIDNVLLPMDIFTPKSPAPAPAPAQEKPNKKKTPPAGAGAGAGAAESPVVQTPLDTTTSSAESFMHSQVVFLGGVGVFAAIFWLV